MLGDGDQALLKIAKQPIWYIYMLLKGGSLLSCPINACCKFKIWERWAGYLHVRRSNSPSGRWERVVESLSGAIVHIINYVHINNYIFLTNTETLSRNNQITLFRLHFSQLNLGDIIGVGCSGSGRLLGIFHLGIYVGNAQVIDYTNDSRVHKAHLDDFLRTSSSSSSPNKSKGSHMGDLLRIHYRGRSPKYNPEEIKKRAHREYTSQTFGSTTCLETTVSILRPTARLGKSFHLKIKL